MTLGTGAHFPVQVRSGVLNPLTKFVHALGIGSVGIVGDDCSDDCSENGNGKHGDRASGHKQDYTVSFCGLIPSRFFSKLLPQDKFMNLLRFSRRTRLFGITHSPHTYPATQVKIF